MLIIFKSKASGDVIMFGDVGKQLLSVMGKSPEPKGIITPEQLPDAIQRLQDAIARSKAQPADTTEADDTPKAADGERVFVSLAVRAVPLLQLLERSLKAKTPVIWGA
jgi:hypothetical protein